MENKKKPFQTENFNDLRNNLHKMQGLMGTFADMRLKELKGKLETFVSLVKTRQAKEKLNEEQLKDALKRAME